MAVSDPTMGVPTPTGVLQGVATFSWDGSQWQPAGRAGPSVATPTGVLRGVAAFNGGPSWQPAAQAGPGVATPTGVLDGVAVYTWSGSQWTPPGGQPSSSTQTGALRGIAAFDWDGTAWQPAGRAGPDVATPYGVLQGVARFQWTGTAWAAVGAPSLSLDFMTPGALDPRIAFARASTATYTDATGTIQTAAVNAPRWDYDPVTHALRGLLIEEARTNYCTNSMMSGVVTGTPGTDPTGWNLSNNLSALGLSKQIVAAGVLNGISYIDVRYFGTAAAGNFYLQTPGNGGATTPGTNWNTSVYNALIGGALTNVSNLYLAANYDTGAPVALDIRPSLTPTLTRYSVSGTAAAGVTIIANLFWSVTVAAGPVDFTLRIGAPQLEQGAFATSVIITTVAAVTRAQDSCTISAANMAPWFVSPGGSWFAEFITLNPTPPGGSTRVIGQPTAGLSGPVFLMTGPANALGQYDGAGAFGTANTTPVNTIAKGVTNWVAGTAKACLNGGTIASSAALTTGYGVLASGGVRFGADSGPGDGMTGTIRRVSYWPRVLSDAEMQQVTT